MMISEEKSCIIHILKIHNEIKKSDIQNLCTKYVIFLLYKNSTVISQNNEKNYLCSENNKQTSLFLEFKKKRTLF